jgi:hypothetical protein
VTDPAVRTVAAVLGGAPVDAGPGWHRPFGLPAGDALWGRGPDDARPLAAAGRHLVARWVTLAGLRLAPPAGHRLGAVHRVPARRLGGRLGWARTVVRSGAVAELLAPGERRRPLDEILEEAGATPAHRRLRVLSAGVVMLDVVVAGSPARLRVAVGEAATGLERAQAVLRSLADVRSPLIPVPLGAGRLDDLAWTVESCVPGHRPGALDTRLLDDASAFLAGLVTSGGPRRRLADDLAGLDQLRGLATLAAEVDGVLDDLPTVVRHGDLWTGNLLTDRGRLTGVVDWDGACQAAPAGTDLLHLVATEHRLRSRCSLGEVWRAEPWTWPAYADAPYWRLLDCRPTPRQRWAIGVAWWAAQAAGDVARAPHLLDDPGWRADNVDAVTAHLAGAR